MRILIVEDSLTEAKVLKFALEKQGHETFVAGSAEEALEQLKYDNFPIVISDWELPGLPGVELCRAIRQRSSHHYTYVIMLTSRNSKRHVVEGLAAGADDYLTKPFEPLELFFRIRVGERLLGLQGRDVIIFSLAKLAESRDPDTGAHLERIREYCRVLAQEVRKNPEFASIIDADYVESIYLTSPLHDIGKVGIPDYVLQKPGKLTEVEFDLMKKHTVIGGQTLDAAAKQHPSHPYLLMARDIAMSHHEKFDGTGYPHGLSGENIPLCGRIVSVADVYDALTSKRVYKPAFPHERAVELILKDSGSRFDPRIIDAFKVVEREFARIKQELTDEHQESTGLLDAEQNLKLNSFVTS